MVDLRPWSSRRKCRGILRGLSSQLQPRQASPCRRIHPSLVVVVVVDVVVVVVVDVVLIVVVDVVVVIVDVVVVDVVVLVVFL